MYIFDATHLVTFSKIMKSHKMYISTYNVALGMSFFCALHYSDCGGLTSVCSSVYPNKIYKNDKKIKD